MYKRLALILLASLLQFHQLAQDTRFHPDEAFFMTFARNASVNGDWMLSGSLDKPPLSIYTSAVSMMFMGVTADDNGVLQLDVYIGEFAGRLPNAVYAILLVALMMRLADDLYRNERVALFAGLLTATSPYLLIFGATAFTDMSLLFWGVLAIWLMLIRRYGWAGLALGLAIWSKQQAIFFVPFVLGIYYLNFNRRREEACFFPTIRFILITSLMILILFLWDTSRPETSIFILGTVNNSPDSLIAPLSDYLLRLGEWLNLSGWLIGHPILTWISLILAIWGTYWHVIHRDKHYRLDIILWLYSIAYVILHTVLAFNQYDRYLLIILPALILLCARGLTQVGRILSLQRYIIKLFGFILIVSSLYISHTHNPIGGNGGKYQGVNELADYLNSKPIATVIYDRWLGWELGYYMGQWTNKRRVYYPTPNALVAGALELDEIGDRYLIAPMTQDVTSWILALEDVGFIVVLDYEDKRFKSYRLSVPASDA